MEMFNKYALICPYCGEKATVKDPAAISIHCRGCSNIFKVRVDPEMLLRQLYNSLTDALGDIEDNPHGFDLSDDDWLSGKRRKLLNAMRAAESYIKSQGGLDDSCE